MLKIRTYLIVAIIVYFGVLVSSLPASLLVNQLEKQSDGMLVTSSVSGSVWKGQLDGQISKQAVFLEWDINLLRLFLFEFSLDMNMSSDLFDLKVGLGISPSRLYFEEANGLVRAEALNKLFQENQAGFLIENDIYLKNVDLSRVDSQFTHAEGKLTWQGGEVQVENLPSGNVEFPEVHADLLENETGLLLDIAPASDEGLEQNIVQLALSHEGIMHIKIMEYIADFVEIPNELKQGSPDAVIFEIKRDLLTNNGSF